MPRKATRKAAPKLVFGDFFNDPSGERDRNLWREIRCARHHFAPIGTCKCRYVNPQYIIHGLPDKEVLAFGGKGSVKTEGTFGTIIAGSPSGHCCPHKGEKGHDKLGPHGEIITLKGTRCLWCASDISYINHPRYKFLILRRTTRDLEDWVGRAKSLYEMKMGATVTADPPRVVFRSGATGICGHMDTEDAYEKWWGQEFTRIFFEEIQQCPSEKLYSNIKLSNRTSERELRCQVFCTANPGGAGNQWIRRKWWDIPGRAPMDVVAHVKRQLKDEAGPLMIRKKNPRSKQSTIVVHSTVYDNPFLCTYKDGKRDPDAADYARDLEAEPSEKRRRQLLWGDPYCFEGAYFDIRERPLSDEEPHVYHIVPSKPSEDDDHREVVNEHTLEGWWPRAIGLDWGRAHRAAAMWGCWHPSGRLYIYRELSIAGLSPMQIGSELAKRSRNDFKKSTSPHIPVYASHDAFWNRDDASNTFAHQIKAGIDKVLGDDSAFLKAPTEAEMQLDVRAQWLAVKERENARRPSTLMTISRASNDRVPGWNLIQDLLRWKSILPEKKELDERYAIKLRLEFGKEVEAEYRWSFENREEEVLPRMRITDDCPALRRSLQSCVHDEKKPEDVLKATGDDEADALRYLVVEFPFQEGRLPREAEILAAAEPHLHPNMSGLSRFQVMERQEAMYAKRNKKSPGVTLARKSGRRARIGLQARLRGRDQVAGRVW